MPINTNKKVLNPNATVLDTDNYISQFFAYLEPYYGHSVDQVLFGDASKNLIQNFLQAKLNVLAQPIDFAFVTRSQLLINESQSLQVKIINDMFSQSPETKAKSLIELQAHKFALDSSIYTINEIKEIVNNLNNKERIKREME